VESLVAVVTIEDTEPRAKAHQWNQRVRAPPPLELAGLEARGNEPRYSRACVSLLTTFLKQGLKPHEACLRAAELGRRSYLGKELYSFAQAIDGGASVSEAMRKHRGVFSTLAAEFACIGERGHGLVKSFERYLDLREKLARNAWGKSPAVTSRKTRDFALIAGTALELSDDLILAFRLGAIEQRTRFRVSVAEAIGFLRAGEGPGDAIESAGKGRFLGFRFDPLFVATLRTGESVPKISKLMQAFGSEPWSLAPL
jgi:type II secretory pathway component PulF